MPVRVGTSCDRRNYMEWFQSNEGGNLHSFNYRVIIVFPSWPRATVNQHIKKKKKNSKVTNKETEEEIEGYVQDIYDVLIWWYDDYDYVWRRESVAVRTDRMGFPAFLGGALLDHHLFPPENNPSNFII